MSRSSLFFAFAVAILAAVEGYVVPQSANRQSTALSAQSSRRAFAVASMGAAFATLASGAPAFALDDLAMPSGGDADAQSVSTTTKNQYQIFRLSWTAPTPTPTKLGSIQNRSAPILPKAALWGVQPFLFVDNSFVRNLCALFDSLTYLSLLALPDGWTRCGGVESGDGSKARTKS